MLLLYAFALIKYITGQFDEKPIHHQESYSSNTQDVALVSDSTHAVLKNQVSDAIARGGVASSVKSGKGKSATPRTAAPIVKEVDYNISSKLNNLEPDDSVTAVVECSTSTGNLTIDVRGNWAPLGSAQFLSLVDKKLFSHLPFFRVCPRYIAQFGAKYNYHEPISGIQDDPSLWGVRDMDFGYVFFAVSRTTRHN
jgi:hypothetical protein